MLSKLLVLLSKFLEPGGIRNGEAPAVEVTHPILGTLRWLPDDEAWIGSYRDFGFSLRYEGRATPSEPLIAYALDVMGDPGWLEATFSAARDEAIRTIRTLFHGRDPVAVARTDSFPPGPGSPRHPRRCRRGPK